MKYTFQYQKVLDFKEKQQEIAKQEFGAIKLRQKELEQELEGLETVEDVIFGKYNEVNRKTISEILEIQEDIDHVAKKKRLLQTQTDKIHQEAEFKQQVLLNVSMEAKTWNKWKAKSAAAFQKQQELKEQAMLDEMAVIRYSRKI